MRLVSCLVGLAVVAGSLPEQVHIAFAGRSGDGHPTGMNIAWYTSDSQESIVQYGTTSGALHKNVSGSQAVQYLNGHGYHHLVAVLDLSPATLVYYRVGSGNGWSAEFSFKTAPQAASAGADVDFGVAMFGDMGWLDSDQRPMVITRFELAKHWSASLTRERLEVLKDAGSYDFLWHLGDIGYADDAIAHHPVGFYYEAVYNGFVNWMQNISATMPYMVSVGNHESECHSLPCLLSGRGKALSNFSAYNARYRNMPAAESAARAGSAMWYSWNYGNVHFVSLNSETDWDGAEEHDTGDSHDTWLPAGHFGEDGEYMAWLEADLKAASEARARAERRRENPSQYQGAAGDAGGWAPTFIVAGGHRPYGFSREHQALFARYGVDLHVSGHGHSYHRGAPVNGTTYIMAGGAGCDEMGYLESPPDGLLGWAIAQVGAAWAGLAAGPDTPRQGRAPSGEGFESVFATKQLATGLLRVNSTALHFELIDSKDGSVLDTVDITASAQREARAAFAARFTE